MSELETTSVETKRPLQRLTAGLSRAVENWKTFWFRPEDPFTLGITRFLTGWMLAYNLLVWGQDLHSFFGSHGLQPLNTIRSFYANDLVFSFLFYVPDDWLTVVHWSCFGIALLFCLGVCTRVTSVLSFLITISYSHRVPVANFGLDQILGMLCLYLAIGPSGAAFSLDSWWRNRRRKNRGLQAEIRRSGHCRMALRLIQIHICIIYFWAGFAKLKGDSWWTGEALWQVIANQEYQTTDLTWMAWVPWLPYLVAHITVAWEVFFCVLVWNRHWRPLMLLVGTGMHFGIGAFLGMWTFGLIMTYAYFAFTEPADWRRRLGWLWGKPPTRDAHSNASTDSTVEASDALVAAIAMTPEESKPVSSVTELDPVTPSSTDESTETPESEVPLAAVEPVSVAAPPAEIADEPDTPTEDFEQPDISPAEQTTSPDDHTLTTVPPNRDLNLAAIPEAVPELADTVLVRDTSILLVTAHPEERTTLRRYFRKHDIPCKAATNSETAFAIVSQMKPVAIVISGSRFQSAQLETLIDDLDDAAEVPILAVVSTSQRKRLQKMETPARLLQYPSTPREIRVELSDLLFGEADSRYSTPPPSSLPLEDHSNT